MLNEELNLVAHLMRRAGFGAARDELEERVAKGYEATVEELLHPQDSRRQAAAAGAAGRRPLSRRRGAVA